MPHTPEFDFQADVRMTYCACVVADVIGSQVTEGSERYLEQCRTWEGGYAAKAGNIEAQGQSGATLEREPDCAARHRICRTAVKQESA